jgi:transposase
LEIKKNTYLCTVEEVIHIRRSEYEQLLSQQAELIELKTLVIKLREQAFINRLRKLRQSIFTFLIYPNVPPDNNGSERSIRNVKVKTKVSGLFRNSEGKGAERFARIRSVIDTTIKNWQDVFCALKCMADIQIKNTT